MTNDLRTRTVPDSLGFGIVLPFRRTSDQDFATAGGPELVKSDLLQLLGTVQGEVPWRQKLGTRLTRLRHRANTQALAALARVEVDRAIARYEPRVRVRSVTSPRPAANKLEIAIDYEVANRPDTAKTSF